jgi:hypothetical protein
MHNVIGLNEFNSGLLNMADKTDAYWTGHLMGKNYVLTGFDTTF